MYNNFQPISDLLPAVNPAVPQSNAMTLLFWDLIIDFFWDRSWLSLLFNIYTYDLPSTISRKIAYADN